VTGAITVTGGSAGESFDMSTFGSLHGVTINAAGGGDTLIGTNLSDILNGEAGTDQIIGAFGADTITGGTGIDTYIYDSVTDSSIITTDTPASGFDMVFMAKDDIFSFSYTLTNSGPGVNAVTSLVISTEAMGSTGTDVLSQLSTAFQSVDNNSADYEAGIIRFTGGQTFLVVDSNSDQQITANDQVIELSGVVTGLTINVDGNIVIA